MKPDQSDLLSITYSSTSCLGTSSSHGIELYSIVNKPYVGKYGPLREKKLPNKLLKTRAGNNNIDLRLLPNQDKKNDEKYRQINSQSRTMMAFSKKRHNRCCRLQNNQRSSMTSVHKRQRASQFIRKPSQHKTVNIKSDPGTCAVDSEQFEISTRREKRRQTVLKSNGKTVGETAVRGDKTLKYSYKSEMEELVRSLTNFNETKVTVDAELGKSLRYDESLIKCIEKTSQINDLNIDAIKLKQVLYDFFGVKFNVNASLTREEEQINDIIQNFAYEFLNKSIGCNDKKKKTLHKECKDNIQGEERGKSLSKKTGNLRFCDSPGAFKHHETKTVKPINGDLQFKYQPLLDATPKKRLSHENAGQLLTSGEITNLSRSKKRFQVPKLQSKTLLKQHAPKYEILSRFFKQSVHGSSSNINISLTTSPAAEKLKPKKKIRTLSSISSVGTTVQQINLRAGINQHNKYKNHQSLTTLSHKAVYVKPKNKRCFHTLKLQETNTLPKEIDFTATAEPHIERKTIRLNTKTNKSSYRRDRNLNKYEPNVHIPDSCDSYNSFNERQRANLKIKGMESTIKPFKVSSSKSKIITNLNINKPTKKKHMKVKRKIQQINKSVSIHKFIDKNIYNSSQHAVGSTLSFEIQILKNNCDNIINNGSNISEPHNYQRKCVHWTEKSHTSIVSLHSVKNLNLNKLYEDKSSKHKVLEPFISLKAGTFLKQLISTTISKTRIKRNKLPRRLKTNIPIDIQKKAHDPSGLFITKCKYIFKRLTKTKITIHRNGSKTEVAPPVNEIAKRDIRRNKIKGKIEINTLKFAPGEKQSEQICLKPFSPIIYTPTLVRKYPKSRFKGKKNTISPTIAGSQSQYDIKIRQPNVYGVKQTLKHCLSNLKLQKFGKNYSNIELTKTLKNVVCASNENMCKENKIKGCGNTYNEIVVKPNLYDLKGCEMKARHNSTRSNTKICRRRINKSSNHQNKFHKNNSRDINTKQPKRLTDSNFAQAYNHQCMYFRTKSYFNTDGLAVSSYDNNCDEILNNLLIDDKVSLKQVKTTEKSNATLPKNKKLSKLPHMFADRRNRKPQFYAPKIVNDPLYPVTSQLKQRSVNVVSNNTFEHKNFGERIRSYGNPLFNSNETKNNYRMRNNITIEVKNKQHFIKNRHRNYELKYQKQQTTPSSSKEVTDIGKTLKRSLCNMKLNKSGKMLNRTVQVGRVDITTTKSPFKPELPSDEMQPNNNIETILPYAHKTFNKKKHKKKIMLKNQSTETNDLNKIFGSCCPCSNKICQTSRVDKDFQNVGKQSVHGNEMQIKQKEVRDTNGKKSNIVDKLRCFGCFKEDNIEKQNIKVKISTKHSKVHTDKLFKGVSCECGIQSDIGQQNGKGKQNNLKHSKVQTTDFFQQHPCIYEIENNVGKEKVKGIKIKVNIKHRKAQTTKSSQGEACTCNTENNYVKPNVNGKKKTTKDCKVQTPKPSQGEPCMCDVKNINGENIRCKSKKTKDNKVQTPKPSQGEPCLCDIKNNGQENINGKNKKTKQRKVQTAKIIQQEPSKCEYKNNIRPQKVHSKNVKLTKIPNASKMTKGEPQGCSEACRLIAEVYKNAVKQSIEPDKSQIQQTKRSKITRMLHAFLEKIKVKKPIKHKSHSPNEVPKEKFTKRQKLEKGVQSNPNEKENVVKPVKDLRQSTSYKGNSASTQHNETKFSKSFAGKAIPKTNKSQDFNHNKRQRSKHQKQPQLGNRSQHMNGISLEKKITKCPPMPAETTMIYLSGKDVNLDIKNFSPQAAGDACTNIRQNMSKTKAANSKNVSKKHKSNKDLKSHDKLCGCCKCERKRKKLEAKLTSSEPAGVTINYVAGLECKVLKDYKPCVCGTDICTNILKDKKKQKKIERMASRMKPCVCGHEDCKHKRQKMLKKMITEYENRYCDCSVYYTNIKKQRARAKQLKKKQRYANKQLKKRRKIYKKEDTIRAKKRKKEDKKMLKQVKKFKNTSDVLLVIESFFDIAKLGCTTAKDILRSSYRTVVDPKNTYFTMKTAIKDPKRGKVILKNAIEESGVIATVKRVKMRVGLTKCGKSIKKFLESHAFTSYLLHINEKDPMKRLKYHKKRKKRFRKRIPVDFGCSLYISSLRRKPCLAVYYMYPWFYPHCITLLNTWRQLTNMMLSLLAVIVWSPCIIVTEACRGLLCCILCTG